MKVLLVTDAAVLRHSIAQAIVDSGHEVRALTRADDRPTTSRPARVEPWPAAPGDLEALTRAANGCGAAIVIDDRLVRLGRTDADTAAFTAEAAAALSRGGVRLVLVSPRVPDQQSEAEPHRSAALRIRSDA